MTPTLMPLRRFATSSPLDLDVAACPICAGGARALFTLPHTTVAECSNGSCGCRFATAGQQPGVDLKALQFDSYGTGEQRPILFERVLPQLRGMLSRDRPELLDIGAGAGNLCPMARRLGFSYSGVEIVEEARREALSAHGVRLWPALEDLPANYRCDLVFMSEVIEHVPKPMDLLRAVRALLRSGGLLYLTTPNANGLRARVEGSGWHSYEAPAHVIYFTDRSLGLALATAGFGSVDRMCVHIPLSDESPVRRAVKWMLVKTGLEGTLRLIARPG